jgi:hypothetical protein
MPTRKRYAEHMQETVICPDCSAQMTRHAYMFDHLPCPNHPQQLELFKPYEKTSR